MRGPFSEPDWSLCIDQRIPADCVGFVLADGSVAVYCLDTETGERRSPPTAPHPKELVNEEEPPCLRPSPLSS